MRIHKIFRGVPILLGLSVLVVLLLGSAVKKGKKSPSVQEQLNQISASISAIDSLLRGPGGGLQKNRGGFDGQDRGSGEASTGTQQQDN